MWRRSRWPRQSVWRSTSWTGGAREEQVGERRDVKRARILLGRAEGRRVDTVAAEVGVNRNTVMLCERQFREGRLDAALVDAAGRGASTSGHSRGEWGQDVSVCAHRAPARVQSRTRGGRFGRLRVRLCTRSLMACAKSDTRPAVSRRSCPLVHTGRYACAKSDTRPAVSRRSCPLVHTVECPVCTSGHDVGRGAWEPPRARGQRPAGPRGRPKRSLRADKGCLSSRFSAGLTRRGAPRIAGRHARASRGESAPRPAEECRTFSEAGTWRRRSGGRA